VYSWAEEAPKVMNANVMMHREVYIKMRDLCIANAMNKQGKQTGKIITNKWVIFLQINKKEMPIERQRI
jgi:hypothetical protein